MSKEEEAWEWAEAQEQREQEDVPFSLFVSFSFRKPEKMGQRIAY